MFRSAWMIVQLKATDCRAVCGATPDKNDRMEPTKRNEMKKTQRTATIDFGFGFNVCISSDVAT